MELPGLDFTNKNGIAYLTLNRPRKLNALNPSLMSSLNEALDSIEKNKNIRVAIVTGAGNAFSAGFDLNIGSRETQDMDACLLYTSPSPRDRTRSRMPSSA